MPNRLTKVTAVLLVTLNLLSLLFAAPVQAQNALDPYYAPQLTTPNYWGDSRVQSVGMGDYRSPYTGAPVYNNGTTFTNRSLPYNYSSTYYNPGGAQSGRGGGFNSMGLIVGAGAIGGAALLMNAGRLAGVRRGGYHPGSTDPEGYQKDMAKAEKRRKDQEEKLHAELAKAHQDNLKRKGLGNQDSALANAPQGAVPAVAAGDFTPVDNKPQSMVSESGLASQKFDNAPVTDPLPGDTAQAVSF